MKTQKPSMEEVHRNQLLSETMGDLLGELYKLGEPAVVLCIAPIGDTISLTVGEIKVSGDWRDFDKIVQEFYRKVKDAKGANIREV